MFVWAFVGVDVRIRVCKVERLLCRVHVWYARRGVRAVVAVMQGKSGVEAVAGAFRQLRACEALPLRLCVGSGSSLMKRRGHIPERLESSSNWPRGWLALTMCSAFETM